jgi:3-hydroxyacyl-CoA dehydrogenase
LQREVDNFVSQIADPNDQRVRAFRFLEEALELAQACGVTPAEVNALRDYTFGRPVGEIDQEIAGTAVTLFALATAYGYDVGELTQNELQRATRPEVLAKIRAKAAAAPDGPLPQ